MQLANQPIVRVLPLPENAARPSNTEFNSNRTVKVKSSQGNSFPPSSKIWRTLRRLPRKSVIQYSLRAYAVLNCIYIGRITVANMAKTSWKVWLRRYRFWRNCQLLRSTVWESPVLSSPDLEVSGVRKWEGWRTGEGQGMRLVPTLWREMSVKNTSPKCIAC